MILFERYFLNCKNYCIFIYLIYLYSILYIYIFLKFYLSYHIAYQFVINVYYEALKLRMIKHDSNHLITLFNALIYLPYKI